MGRMSRVKGKVGWATIPRFSNYMVSSAGDFVSRKGRTGPKCVMAFDGWHYMKPYTSRSGYRTIQMFDDDGKLRHMRCGRAVLSTFVGEPGPGMECCHGDGNRANDALENLRWGTHADNEADRRLHGMVIVGERHANAKMTDSKAAEVIHRLFHGESASRIARDVGVTKQAVISIRMGRTWKHITRPGDLRKTKTGRPAGAING